ncbi:MAG: pentapeptide repeat-containing protein [Acidobacteriota bacterium]|nr:pentapeptide repeat-containing protein [Acidobacteriota bacterium]
MILALSKELVAAMVQARVNCKFKLWYSDDFKCPHPAKRNSLCIFHLPKQTKDKKEQLQGAELDAALRLEEEFLLKIEDLLEQFTTSSEIEFIDFRGFCFPSINWKGKEFFKKLDLQNATFYQDVHFDKAIFHEEADFHSVTFMDAANFHEAIFNGKADFGIAKFNQWAGFSEAVFREEAVFLTEFGATAYFHGSTFHRNATFIDARFKGSAIFPKTTFKGEAWFLTVVFMDMANFIEATFDKKAIFSSSFFEQKTTFAGALFSEQVSFRDSTFSEDCSFKPYTRTCVLGECDFRRLNLKAEAQINFHQVYLGKARFIDTDLLKINFRDIEWGASDSKWLSRSILWDEVCSLEEDDGERNYEKVAENYRQLVLNYEAKRDYDLAEAFHIGEMEMRRKKKGAHIKSSWLRWLREKLNAYWLYRLLSNYGTSYWQAFIMLKFLVLFFAATFLYSGFQPTKENIGSTDRIIEYNLIPDSTHHSVSFGKWLADYREAILFALSIITFQRERFYVPVGWQSQLFLYLAVLVMTTQAALLLLSIRRRFRR